MTPSTLSPLGATVRGALAGAAGTAVMTAVQTAYYKATDSEGSNTPGEVLKRIVEGVLQRDFPEDKMGAATQGMHWAYGTSMGVPYGIVSGSRRRRPTSVIGSTLAFGLPVWAAGQVQLPAMQMAPPPWEMPPSSLAMDLGFHLAYGLGGALAWRVLR
jgi:hypothetical protein